MIATILLSDSGDLLETAQDNSRIPHQVLQLITIITTNNNVYVIDKINTRVQMFDKEGNYLTGWGSYGKGPEQLNQPEDIAVNNKGLIYVTDTRNSRVQILEVKN